MLNTNHLLSKKFVMPQTLAFCEEICHIFAAEI